ELWRDAVRDAPAAPAYLEEGTEGWRPVSWDEAAERIDSLARGLLAHDGRLDPPRLGDHVDRRRRRRPLPDELREGMRVRPRALRSSRRLRRGRRADPQARLRARLAPGAARDPDVRPSREARGGGPRLAPPAARAGGGGRSGDAHLHVRHHRAAEGL